MPTPARTVHLRGGGVSVVIAAEGPVPIVLHWGRDLGDLTDSAVDDLRRTAVPAITHNAPDTPRVLSIWPSERDGWAGTPALSGHAGGLASHSRVQLVDVTDTGNAVTFHLVDGRAGLGIEVRYLLDPSGILAVSTTLRRTTASGGDRYTVDAVTSAMPVPSDATELLDFTGAWLTERRPQRSGLVYGSNVRTSRRGRTGHDAAFLTVVGTPGFRFRTGELWAVHLAWSGDQRSTVDHLPEGAGVHATSIGAGELLRPGEVMLAVDETYAAPTVLFGWSDGGLDGLAARFHGFRRGSPQHPTSPRPLVLNTWESVYFDHDLPRLLSLVDRAAALGAERFVLDDGWFTGRRDATGALGDWTVDDTTWPEGLHPLVDAVRAGGMQFGLWVEPEALSPRSALAAEHPEWMLAPSEDVGPTARNQHVLNLADAGAFAHILDLLDRLIGEYRVDYLKWDHNRDLLEAVDRGTGRARVHDQTHATYALMDELHRRHPHLEIESCAGGGGRVDLGVAEHVDRFWASDCNDPVERTEIERWTALLVPPELIGTHVGAPRSHTTGRVSDLSFRLATTMFGHAGIEWDLATVDDEDLAVLAEWAALYKRMRSLIAGGTVVNADLADDGTLLRGVISPDADAGLFLWARLRSSIAGQPGRVRIPGLDPGAHYTVAVIDSLGPVRRATAHDPEWMDEPGFTCAGRVLATAGLPLPGLAVESGMLLELRRADR